MTPEFEKKWRFARVRAKHLAAIGLPAYPALYLLRRSQNCLGNYLNLEWVGDARDRVGSVLVASDVDPYLFRQYANVGVTTMIDVAAWLEARGVDEATIGRWLDAAVTRK